MTLISVSELRYFSGANVEESESPVSGLTASWKAATRCWWRASVKALLKDSRESQAVIVHRVDYTRVHAHALKLFLTSEHKPLKLWVRTDSARESYRTAIVPRGELAGTVLEPMQPVESNFEKLGLTPLTYSQELLAFGYYANYRCNPKQIIEYFIAFSTIVRLMDNLSSCPQPLQEILASEESRQQDHLKIDCDEDIPDEFIENAYKSGLKMTWSDPSDGASRQKFTRGWLSG
ncbi:hypothetical protein K435DRAFT_790383 [Dendrothele bispora CBS 962.96]|uniref:Uncharacterized protein n=1 Tax=Dendrothele bispora (strain CBS 962.96) TaxID=1314807 RepID=A0A4S8MQU2_DENBC|nr:hypothetical protein K435DRAFT_790383 [Dendrothele bispora CBS 962.96]